VWYDEIKDTLTSMGYQHTNANHALFARHDDEPPSLITLSTKKTMPNDLGEIAWIHL
jgi:hypothetical protein